MCIPPPLRSDSELITSVFAASEDILGEGCVEKSLIYLPDAIGEGLVRDYEKEFESIRRIAPFQIPISSVYPSVTPVCFASMFTGVKPEVHGVTRYEKPVLAIDTIFDALPRAGKKAVIVSVEGSSMSLIFGRRPIDYYPESYDPEVRQRVLEILRKEDYDLIVAYLQEYDDVMHRTGPRSPEAIEAFRRTIKGFEILTSVFLERYIDQNRLVAFLPDHGTHTDPTTGRGTHGANIPEDMQVRHFWGIYQKSPNNDSATD
jgi:predicted AlkP superfamily pyrophosphatase or phosphodiesterase